MPNKIGRFEILSEIVKSEAGCVYKASDPENGQTVALKVVRLDSSEPSALLQEILEEVQSTKILNSHNIALVYGADEVEGQLCAAMEYVQGNGIATMLARKEGFSIWDLLDISRQACQGLDHAHSHQVVHYSLEPAKVMVTWDGTVKILGFGISKIGSLAAQASGTPPEVLHYMSPEQLRGEPLDARSNLFSWGAVLYEMVTEHKAFDGEDADAVRHKILEEAPVPPAHLVPKVHPALSEVIMKALSKAPEQRYQSGQDVVNDLEKCKESATKVAAKKPSQPPQGLNVPGQPKAAVPAPSTTARTAPVAPKTVVPKPEPKSPARPAEAAKAGPTISAAQTAISAAGAASPQGAGVPARKAAAAAAAGASATAASAAAPRTPKLDPSAQFITSCVKASVEALTQNEANLSAAGTAEEEAETPGIAVDPMMAAEARGKAVQGPSFSEIDELPPLKEIYVAPPPPPAPDLPQPVLQGPVLVHPAEPPKPKVQPREVARKAVKEIKKTPPKLFVYSVSGAVAIILAAIIGIAYHIHSQNEEDEDTGPVAATTASAPAARQAPAPVQPTEATPQAAAPEEVPVEQPAVTVQPRYTSKRKPPKAAPAPVIIPGQLTVNSTPEGAQVKVDGRTDANWVTPYNLSGLAPGQHTVSVTRAGFATETRAVEITAGSKLFLVVQLAPVSAVFSVTSEPAGASIFVDGKNTSRVTPAQINLEKGSHTVLVRKQGYLDETTTANAQPGQTFHFSPALRVLGTTDDIKMVGKFKKFFGGGDVSGMGAVSIKTQPKGAQVAINRRILDKATPLQFYLNPGNYEMDISYSGYKPIHRILTVEKDGKVAFDETLDRE
jgi:serine/threonine-protein kinase